MSLKAQAVGVATDTILFLFSFFAVLLNALGCHQFSALPAWDVMPLHAPGFEVACSLIDPRPPRLLTTGPPCHSDISIDLIRPNLSDLVWLSSSL
jgi:hypothetical protein